MKEIVEQQIQTVFDPEFPLIDIWTMGLIYDVQANEETQQVDITMTYTTPACPS
jgi:metal-sulfur cluster biosynthetic enzyme